MQKLLVPSEYSITLFGGQQSLSETLNERSCKLLELISESVGLELIYQQKPPRIVRDLFDVLVKNRCLILDNNQSHFLLSEKDLPAVDAWLRHRTPMSNISLKLICPVSCANLSNRTWPVALPVQSLLMQGPAELLEVLDAVMGSGSNAIFKRRLLNITLLSTMCFASADVAWQGFYALCCYFFEESVFELSLSDFSHSRYYLTNLLLLGPVASLTAMLGKRVVNYLIGHQEGWWTLSKRHFATYLCSATWSFANQLVSISEKEMLSVGLMFFIGLVQSHMVGCATKNADWVQSVMSATSFAALRPLASLFDVAWNDLFSVFSGIFVASAFSGVTACFVERKLVQYRVRVLVELLTESHDEQQDYIEIVDQPKQQQKIAKLISQLRDSPVMSVRKSVDADQESENQGARGAVEEAGGVYAYNN